MCIYAAYEWILYTLLILTKPSLNPKKALETQRIHSSHALYSLSAVNVLCAGMRWFVAARGAWFP